MLPSCTQTREALARGSQKQAWYPIQNFFGAPHRILFPWLSAGSPQISWYCPERKCIIQSPTRAEVESGAVIRVCGRDVLTNEQVNLITVSAAGTRALSGSVYHGVRSQFRVGGREKMQDVPLVEEHHMASCSLAFRRPNPPPV